MSPWGRRVSLYGGGINWGMEKCIWEEKCRKHIPSGLCIADLFVFCKIVKGNATYRAEGISERKQRSLTGMKAAESPQLAKDIRSLLCLKYTLLWCTCKATQFWVLLFLHFWREIITRILLAHCMGRGPGNHNTKGCIFIELTSIF